MQVQVFCHKPQYYINNLYESIRIAFETHRVIHRPVRYYFAKILKVVVTERSRSLTIGI